MFVVRCCNAVIPFFPGHEILKALLTFATVINHMVEWTIICLMC